jgi:RNA polymerase sigma-70 factor (ECF subfamily)
MRTREDRCFDRFRRTGDAEALAVVFDRTARDLVRFARLLVGADAAEDLVQATFVDAIEHADRFDEMRRVRPWLFGMLANHARRHRRAVAREAAALRIAAARSPQRSAPPADVVAADAERADRVRRTIAELDEPYASVLALHLDEGLNAGEIAARLARPAGTVRTQLVRAYDRFRRRLPAALPGVALGATRPALAELSGLRRRILDLAEARPAAASLAPPVVGVLLMKKYWLAAAALAVVSLGTVALVTGGGGRLDREAADPVVPPPPAVLAATPAPDAGALPPDPTPAERTEVARTDAATPVPVPLRVVTADRTPAAAQVVSLRLDGRLIAQRTSDTAGIASFDELPDAATVQAGCETTPVERLERAADGVFEFVLPAGPRVGGRVVDAAGTPVDGAEIRVHRWGARRLTPGDPIARSDAHGRFTVVVPGGDTVVLGVRKDGHAAGGSLVVPVGTDDAVIRLGAVGRRLTGRVFDPSGAPAPFCRLTVAMLAREVRRIGDVQGRDFTATLDADAEGRFEAGWLPVGAGVVAATDAGPSPLGLGRPLGWAVAETFDLSETPGEDLVLRGAAPATIDALVVDAAGAPIADARIDASLVAARFGFGPALAAHARSDADGRATLGPLAAGRFRVRATRDGLSIEAETEVRAGVAQTVELRSTVETAPLEVVVADPSGAPLTGWQVRVTGGGLRAPTTSTDAAGRARFDVRPAQRYRVAVLRQEVPVASRDGVDSAAGPVRITVDPAASAPGGVRGRVVADGPVAGRMLLVPAGGGVQLEAPLEPDGAFEFRRTTAGAYRLHLQSDTHFADRPGVTVPPGDTADVGEITVRRAATVAVRIPGTTGPEADAMRVLIGPPDETLPMTRDASTPDRWTAPMPFEPGFQTLTVLGPDTVPLVRRVELVSGPNRIDLERPPAGSRVRLDITLAKRAGPLQEIARCVLRVRTAAGDEVAGERYFGHFDDFEARLLVRRLALRPGSYVVEVSGGKNGAVVPFEVPASGVETVVAVVVR